ncbi:MAG: ATP-binding protein [Paludibacteraceae bacterium]|nr:ATP-binding protein [Paludibacteraceae bacterium]
MDENYRKRVADILLQYRLEEMGAVLVEGPKWCGKTTTSERQAASVIYMDDPDMKEQYAEMARTQINMLLEGATPHLIDEWQVAPKLWDAIRFAVDHRKQKEGQFILTGSSVPADFKQIEHSGTGRFATLRMRTMSLFESGDSTGEVRLSSLFDGDDDIRGHNPHTLEDIAYLVCRGGWPGALTKNKRAALRIAYNYYDSLINRDISRVDGVERNSEWADQLLRSYSRLQGSQAPTTVILQDMKLGASDAISATTIDNYLDAFRKLFVVEDMKAWNPNLRSKTAIRVAPTRYLTDPSIAVAALSLGTKDMINNLQTFGFLFETLCVRDLRVFAEALDGKVYHYRDKTELECDAVVHLRNGKYALVEIKLGGSEAIETAAANLKKLHSRLDTEKMNAPSFLMILTAVGQFAYRRSDGIYVVPIGCLGL